MGKNTVQSFTYKGKEIKYVPSDEARALAQKFTDQLDPYDTQWGLYDQTVVMGHADKHMGQDKVQAMNSLLERSCDPEETTFQQSWNSFEDQATARYDIIEGMYNASMHIAAWLCGDLPYIKGEKESEDIDLRSFKRFDLPIQMNGPDEIADQDACYLPGAAFFQTDDDIYLTGNSHIKLILEPIENVYGGFRLVTSYPYNEPDTAPVIQSDVTNLVKETKAYRDADPLMKAVWEYKAMPKPDDRPHAYMPSMRDAFVIECGNDSNIRIYGNGKVRFTGPEGTEGPRPYIDDRNMARYDALYPEQMQIAKRISNRVRNLNDEPVLFPRKKLQATPARQDRNRQQRPPVETEFGRKLREALATADMNGPDGP